MHAVASAFDVVNGPIIVTQQALGAFPSDPTCVVSQLVIKAPPTLAAQGHIQ